ncbi:MAG: hypothetical protein ACK5H0_10210 [Bacteroidota bacterium]|jgi:hypothetical protein
MAAPTSFANTYATAATDKDMLRKRQEMASRLIAAKGQGKSMADALTSETGVDIANLQKGSVDTKMGTGLSEEEIAGYAERLFNPQQKPSETQKPTTEQTGVAQRSITPLLDQYDEYQKTPIGSNLIGAAGLGRGPSRTGGTPIGGGSKSGQMQNIAANLLYKAYRDRQREMKLMGGQEKAFTASNALQ